MTALGKSPRNSGSRGSDVRGGRANSLLFLFDDQKGCGVNSTEEQSGVSFVLTSRPFVSITYVILSTEYLLMISPGRRRQNGWLP